MGMNNFKELQKQEIANTEFKSNNIKSGINSSMGAFRFMGDMLDHFIPKVIGIFVNMAGGDDSKTSIRRPKYPNTPE